MSRRWGKPIRLTESLRAGQPRVAAIALRPPFGVWVAAGQRRHKYLKVWPGENKLFYLYQSLLPSPLDWFDDDFERLRDEFADETGREVFNSDDDFAEVEGRLDALIEAGSKVRQAIVGVTFLELANSGIWNFSGGALRTKPVAKSSIPMMTLRMSRLGFYMLGFLSGSASLLLGLVNAWASYAAIVAFGAAGCALDFYLDHRADSAAHATEAQP